MPRHALAPFAEQRDEQRELRTRNRRRGQDHDGGHDGPAFDVAPQPGRAGGAEPQREQGQAIADHVGQGEAGGLGQAGGGEEAERRLPPTEHHRVGERAEGDPGQRHRQHQPERVDRPAQDRSEHPIPDELHEEEREAHHRGRGEHERGRGGARGWRDGFPGRHGPFVHAVDTARTGEHSRRDGHQQVGEAGQPERPPRPEGLQHEEGGDQAAGHRAQGVDSVKDGGGAPAVVAGMLDRTRGRSQRSPGEDGRHQQHESGQDEARQRAHRPPHHRRAAEADVGLAHQREEPRCRRRRDRDQRLQPRVQLKGIGATVGARPDEPASEAEPAHEHGEHRRRGRGRGAEDQPELASPRRLIREGTGAGSEQQRRRHPKGNGASW